jgi:hypothetical protein
VLESKHSMTVSKAHEISEAWKKAGSQPCTHRFADPLESDEGIDIGTSACAVCGSYVLALQRFDAVGSIRYGAYQRSRAGNC